MMQEVETRWDRAKDGAKTLVERAKESVETATERVMDGLETAAERVKEGAENAAERVKEGAETAAERVKERAETMTERTSTGARRGLLEQLERVTRTVAVARDLGAIDALRRIDTLAAMRRLGVEPKRSAWLPNLAAFGGGMLMGAGAALLFAPARGTVVRQRLLQLAGLEDREKQETGDATATTGGLHEGRPA